MIRWNASSKVPPNTGRWLGLLGVAVSASISLANLATRHLFDDEILSLPFVKVGPREIVQVAGAGDVHPAGMYLLAHVGWVLTGSLRWLNLLPWAVLYAGLAVFVFGVWPLLRSRREQMGFVLLATLHPQLLLWSNTFRWYCPWTGFALLVLVFASQPGRNAPRWSTFRAVLLGLMLGALFYLSYMTILLAAALLAAFWLRMKPEEPARRLRWAGISGVTATMLAIPQMHTLIAVHLGASGGQRSGVAVSAVRLGQALAGSEAFVPWHPVAAAAAILLVGLVLLMLIGRGRAVLAMAGRGSGLGPVLVFGLCFFGLTVFSGLGGKPRNALLLVPILAPLAARGVGRLAEPLSWGVLIVVLAWEGLGIAHVMGEYGLQKADRNDRPEQVVGLVRQELHREQGEEGAGTSCAAVFTYDTGVTFALAQAKLPRVLVVSPSRGSMFEGAVRELPADCAETKVYVVESYPAGLKHNLVLAAEEAKAVAETLPQPSEVRLDRDPDAAAKRRLSRLAGLETGANLPDWRFVVVESTVPRAQVAALRGRMPHFVSGQPDAGPAD